MKRNDAFMSWDEVVSTNTQKVQHPKPVNTQTNRKQTSHNKVSAKNGYVPYAKAPTRTPAEVARQNTRTTRKRKKHRKALAITLSSILGIIVIAITAVALWFGNITSQLNDSNVVSDSLKSELRTASVTTEPFYMLLLGTDGRPGETSYRSDTIMLARIDATAKKVTLISIPRDTMVTINGERQKINAAHAIGGAAGAVKAASVLCGVEISHYAEASFDGMQQLVDAVGGVDIGIEDRVYDPDHFGSDMVLEKGQQHLDGNYAMFYARSRNYADGDYARTRHQRNLVKALATQVLSSTDATTIVPLVNSVASMVKTDMSPTDIIALANAMRGIDSSTGIITCTIPSTTQTVDGVSYVVADLSGLKTLMDKVDVGDDPDGPETMDEGLSASISTIQDSSTSDTTSSSKKK